MLYQGQEEAFLIGKMWFQRVLNVIIIKEVFHVDEAKNETSKNS